jgi:hypothetical protein
VILEAWSANVHCKRASTEWADHTWVYSPENDCYFDCWGDHDGPNKQRIVVGDGCYNSANCYRCPVWPFADTAGIGIFAIDGVCHQSTNCFLYTANRTLNFSVRGYWFSLFSYGTFGRSYRRWLANHYRRCSHGIPSAATQIPLRHDRKGAAGELQEEDPTIRIVHEIYGTAMVQSKPKHPNELLADEVAAVTKLHAPEIDPDQFRGIQLDYLDRKDELIASGHREVQLAMRLDDLARATQREIAKQVGRERYERLMGVPPDVTLGLVNPQLAEAAGVPTPRSEVCRQRAPLLGSRHTPVGSRRKTRTRWLETAVTIAGYAGSLG